MVMYSDAMIEETFLAKRIEVENFVKAAVLGAHSNVYSEIVLYAY